MSNLDKKFKSVVIFLFTFQLLFPQYSYAHALDLSSNDDDILSIANLPGLIIFDKTDASEQVFYSKLPKAEARNPVKKITVGMTAYSSTIDQCDGDPFTTASGARVKDGIVATNMLPFHTKVKIPALYGDKVFTVEDRMNKKFSQRVDIWMETREEAIQFGFKGNVEIEVYE